MNFWGFMGKFLILFGILLVLVGILIQFSDKIPWLGKLPGDIFIQKKNVSFYFPLTTSILVSILLTLLFYFFTRR
jgi:hypothetical protein